MDKIIEPNRVYNVQEAADLLRISQQTVVEYCRNGKIVAQKIGEWKILGQCLIVFMGLSQLVKDLTPILNDHIRVLNDHESRIKEVEGYIRQTNQILDSLNKERLPK